MENQSNNNAPQWLLQLLAQQHDQMTAQAEHQTNQLAALALRLEEKVAAIAHQQRLYETASTNNTQALGNTPDASETPVEFTDPVRRPKPSLNDPERYDHTDKSLYPQFTGLLRAKIKHDGLAIGSEEKQAWYMFGRLRGDAAKRIFPWVNSADLNKTLRTEDLFTQMDIAFLDPRAKEKALTALNRTKQGKLLMNDFLGKFDQLLLEAGG